MVAWGTSGIPPGTGGLLPVLQAGTTGLSWEAAGFQHMGTVVTAAASQLRAAPGWSFSSPGLELGFYGLMLDKGGGELLTEPRSTPLLLPSCALQFFSGKGPWKSLLLPYSCQSQLRGDTEIFMA